MQKQRESLGLPEDQKSLLIFDVFKGQTTEKSLNLTFDLNVNVFFAKTFLESHFQGWYSGEVIS